MIPVEFITYENVTAVTHYMLSVPSYLQSIMTADKLISQRCHATVNQQILAAIKFGVSQNKVIWQLLNLASPCSPSLQCTIDVYVGGDKY